MSEHRPVAVVTGASSGVGAACARQLAGLGWNVLVNYLSNDGGAQETAGDCEKAGADVALVKGDVSQDATCRSIAGTAESRWGRVDALVNNAGTTKFCPPDDLEGLSAEDFSRIYAVNVIGPYRMTRAVAALLRGDGGGSVVNVASMAGITGVGSSTAYAASKGALITMTRSLARVLGASGPRKCRVPGLHSGELAEESPGRGALREREEGA